MLFLTVLFVIVSLLLIYALTADNGENTVHARRHAAQANSQNIPQNIVTLPKKTASKAVSVN